MARIINIVVAELTAMVLAGCTTNPQPFPLPLAPPESKAIFVSNPGTPGPRPAVATGIPGAVTAGDGVEVVVAAIGRAPARGPVFDDGSFAVVVTAAIGDTLEAWLARDNEESDHVVLSFKQGWSFNGPFQLVLTPVQDGRTVVSGPCSPPNDRALVSNLHSGAATLVACVSSGFAASLPAAPGDRVAAFLLDSSGSSGEAAEADVPGP